MTTSRLIQASLVACGALRLPDLEQTDLPEVDARERVAEEGVEARLVDLDLEDAAAAGRYAECLNVLLPAAHVGIDVGAIEDCAYDVEVGVKARTGGND